MFNEYLEGIFKPQKPFQLFFSFLLELLGMFKRDLKFS